MEEELYTEPTIIATSMPDITTVVASGQSTGSGNGQGGDGDPD